MLIYGDRIGKLAELTPSSSAVIFDPTRTKLLLTRRTDNGKWCLRGGAMDPGESAPECCAREVLEETGLVITGLVINVVRLGSSVSRCIVDPTPHHRVPRREPATRAYYMLRSRGYRW